MAMNEVKLTPPTFSGKANPEAYLDWERRLEHIYECYGYNDAKKIALASAQLTDNALSWWDREVAERRRLGVGPFTTWNEVKYLFRRRYVPIHYHRELQKRFRKLTQGHRSVDEYFEEFELLKNRLELDETEEALMAQFVDGLQETIARKVERMTYNEMNELKHLAVQIEHQIKRKSSQVRPRTIQPWTPNANPIRPSDKGKHIEVGNRFKSNPTEPSKPYQPEPNKTYPSTSRARDLTCFKCQGRGHMAKDCPNRRAMIIAANGDIESQDEDEEVDLESNEDIEYPEIGELLVLRRALSTLVQPEETAQRDNLFHTRCTIHNKVCSLIIDSGSCTNVASKYLVDKLGLERVKHPRPYKLRWLNDQAELKIVDQVTIPFSIGRYHDQVVCDVVPMQAGHLLLGRPWQFDKETKHDGRTNLYSLVHEKRKYTLAPLSPSQVHEMQTKMSKEMKVGGSNLYLNANYVIKDLNVQPHLATNDLQEEVCADLGDMELPTKVLDRIEDNSPKEEPLGLPFITRIGQQIINQYGLSKDEYVEKLYQHVHDQLEKKAGPNKLQKLTPTERVPYKHQAKERCKDLSLEPRRVNIRPEIFLHQRRGDGSLKTKEHISNNSLEPPGKNDTYPNFKVTNLASLHVGKTVLRTKLSQGGGDDVTLQTITAPLMKDHPKPSSETRRLKEKCNTTTQAILVPPQEHVDVLGGMYSFSQEAGFLPKGMGLPALVFNEAFLQATSHHASYLALEQESKGAHPPPLLEASPYPYMDSLVPFVSMGLDPYEDDILWVGATAPTKPIQSSTSYPKMDSKESSASQGNSLYIAVNKLLQFVTLNPFVNMAMLFLFQPKKLKPKEAFGFQRMRPLKGLLRREKELSKSN